MILVKKNDLIDFRDTLLLTFLFFSVNVALMTPIIFYGVKILLFSFLCLLMFLIRFTFSNKIFISVLFVLFVFPVILLIQSSYLYYSSYIFDLGFLSIFLAIIVIFIMDYIDKLPNYIILNSIKYNIYIFSLPIVFQFIYVYLFGGNPEVVDISTYLGGDVSRSMGVGEVEGKSFFFRPTGLTSEPAISSGVISSLCALYYLLDKKKYFPILVGVVGMILSMSTLGILLAILFSLIYFVDTLKKTIIFLVGVLVSSSFVLMFLKERIVRFSEGGDTSSNSKLEVVQFFFSDIYIMLFGYSTPNISSFMAPSFFHALNDLGFVFNSIGRFGFLFGGLFALILFYLLFKSKTSWKEKILIFFGVFKLNLLAPFFVIIFIIVSKINNERGK